MKGQLGYEDEFRAPILFCPICKETLARNGRHKAARKGSMKRERRELLHAQGQK